MSRNRIEEVREGRVREVQAYSDHTKNSKFETINVFERENIQMTRLNENIQLTRLNENIPLTQLNENIPMTQINKTIPMT